MVFSKRKPLVDCVVPEKGHHHLMEGHWKSLGGKLGQLLKGKMLEAKYEAMLDFSLGDWMQNTKPFVCVWVRGGGGGVYGCWCYGMVWMLVVWGSGMEIAH